MRATRSGTESATCSKRSVNAQGFPSNSNCGNCYVKIASTLPLTLLDYFTPLNTVSESNGDVDFGSGGPLLLPDIVDSAGKTRHLAVGSGKDANIYVLDRDNMGKFNGGADNIYQLITGQLSGGVYAKPRYFNGTFYYGAVNDTIKAFPGLRRHVEERCCIRLVLAARFTAPPAC